MPSDLTPETIEAALLEMIANNLLETPPDFSIESDLFAAGLDSMAIMQLLVMIEDGFGVAIPPEEMTTENFGTIKAITALVLQYQAVHLPPVTLNEVKKL